MSKQPFSDLSIIFLDYNLFLYDIKINLIVEVAEAIKKKRKLKKKRKNYQNIKTKLNLVSNLTNQPDV